MSKIIAIDSRALDVARLTGDKFTRLMAWADLQTQATENSSTVYIRGEKIDMQRGQLLTSIKELSTRWNISRATTQKYLSEYQQESRLIISERSGLLLLTCVTSTVQITEAQEPSAEIVNHTTDADDTAEMEAWTNPEEEPKVFPVDYPTTCDISMSDPDEKHRYAEGVELTLSEYNDIISTFGEEDALNIIELASKQYAETGSPYLDAHNTIMQDFAPQYFAAKKTESEPEHVEKSATVSEQPTTNEQKQKQKPNEVPPVIKATPAPVPKKIPKKMYAENVKMTESEYNKLVEAYTEEGAYWMITKLDNYKAARGMVYKSDYRAILNWVVKEYQKELSQKQNGNNNGGYYKSTTELAEEKSDAAFANYFSAKYGIG